MAERDVRHAWMKVRDPILSGHLCPACKQGHLTRKAGTWSWDFPVYGVLEVKNAQWYVCDRCDYEAIPPALDEQIDRVMADVDPVCHSEQRLTKAAAKRRARERQRQQTARWRADPEYVAKRAAHSRKWYAEKKRLEGAA